MIWNAFWNLFQKWSKLTLKFLSETKTLPRNFLARFSTNIGVFWTEMTNCSFLKFSTRSFRIQSNFLAHIIWAWTVPWSNNLLALYSSRSYLSRNPRFVLTPKFSNIWASTLICGTSWFLNLKTMCKFSRTTKGMCTLCKNSTTACWKKTTKLVFLGWSQRAPKCVQCTPLPNIRIGSKSTRSLGSIWTFTPNKKVSSISWSKIRTCLANIQDNLARIS